LQKRKYKAEKKQYKITHKKTRIKPPWLDSLIKWLIGSSLLTVLVYWLNKQPVTLFRKPLLRATNGIPALINQAYQAIVNGYVQILGRLSAYFQPPDVGKWQESINNLAKIWIAVLIGFAITTTYILIKKIIRIITGLLDYTTFKFKLGLIKKSFQSYENKSINSFFNIKHAIKFITQFNRKHQDIDDLIKKS
jgi:hypothetical protein